MNVDISLAEPVATRVWFDIKSEQLYVEIDGMVTSIDFQRIPGEDFESSSPIVRFALGYEGTVVICHHRDGAETWLPVDMWQPGGFTPLMPGHNGVNGSGRNMHSDSTNHRLALENQIIPQPAPLPTLNA